MSLCSPFDPVKIDMNESPGMEQVASDASDFSDDQYQTQPIRHGDLFSTVGSSDMAQLAAIDRNEFSDDDIRIIYEIVVRADIILAEELTPSSRLPTHALFLAYDEIIAEYGLDPNERHISKLVFMVGGVKGERSLMDKLKVAMARMDIILAIEEPEVSESGREHLGGHDVRNSTDDFRMNDNEYMPNGPTGEAEKYGYESGSDHVPDPQIEMLDMARERYLADKAEAFQRIHHSQVSAVTTLRRWYKITRYANRICAQSDAIHEAELREALGDKLNIWRALAVEAAQAAPHNVHPNAYSKRTERIAIRTHEILLTKKALVGWRQSAWDEYRRIRNAKVLADQVARQEDEDDDFKENSQLARLAQRAHKNLVLSRAFTVWSNRAEEEAAKAEVAAKAYEMSLKAKALGFARSRSATDGMRELLASKVSGTSNILTGREATFETKQPESPAPAAIKPAFTAPIPSRPHPSSGQPLSSIAIATQLQTRKLAENRPTTLSVRPATVIPITTVSPSIAPIKDVGAGDDVVAPPVEAAPNTKSTEEPESSDDDQPDERTMLARRHILRMRYFGAWETCTREHVAKVEQFEEERQDQWLMRSLSTWRDQTASRRQQAIDCGIEFEETKSNRRAADAVLKWREKTNQETYRQEKVLGYYANRAEYYQKTTRVIPVLRRKTETAQQRGKLLRLYAERTNYYMRSTQALSTWRERAKEVSQLRQLQECYAERADYYYRTQKTLFTWRDLAKRRRKERLKAAHLETRRRVKRGMGEHCIQQWRTKLEPSYERYETMNAALVDALENRKRQRASEAFTTWRWLAQERTEAAATGDAMLKQKAMGQWRERAALDRDREAEAVEHWESKSKSRALKKWNLSSLQSANRPEMVANALEKKERKLLRQGFETWYGRTADKLVPIELPDGTYRNVGQVVQGAQRQAIEHRAREFLKTWRAAATAADDERPSQAQEDAYAPTPGRPRLMLGPFGRMETTTPLAPVPSHARWQARDSTMGRSEFGARGGGSERAKNAKNLRVSWAA
ncbi:hypothetical protein F5B17DRAFT_393125 [Nemania serpens]|nr:hypothetical protein F5B17DRAFT_393125 [Nemania serpens]